MKQSDKKVMKSSAVKVLSIILGVLMVVGAIISFIVMMLPAPKLEKYENKDLKLVSVVCDFSTHASSYNAANKERVLNDLREKSGKKNADEEELMEWYANQIKKEMKGNKLRFTTDMKDSNKIVKYGENEYRYTVSTKASGEYNSFSISGATEMLNGTYTVDTARKKLTHETHLDYVFAENSKLSDIIEITFYYKK